MIAEVLGLDAEGWQAIAALAGTPLVVGTLLLLLVQSRREAESVRASVYQRIADSMLEVDRLFFANPELRRYFYDDVEAPADPHEGTRVVALAELVLDIFEECLMQHRRLRSVAPAEWREYVVLMIEGSPTMRTLRERHPGWWVELDRVYLAARPDARAAAALA